MTETNTDSAAMGRSGERTYNETPISAAVRLISAHTGR
jgi:hypothetical protein